MKIYNKEGVEITEVDFGIVEAGSSAEVELIMENDTSAYVIDIDISVGNDEVFVSDVPQKLGANEKKSFSLKWVPSVTLKKGLKTKLQLQAAEIYR